MDTQNFTVQLMDVDLIVPYDKNPRKTKKAIEPVKKSLKEYGFRQPIFVDEQMVVVDEFTSVIDRQVAQVGSYAIQKYSNDREAEHSRSALRITASFLYVGDKGFNYLKGWKNG